MTTSLHPDELDNVFDDHPSLSASLEDFEENPPPRSPRFAIPSQHSGFRSEASVDPDETLDNGSSTSDPWSPPGFKRTYLHQHNPHLFPSSMPGSAWCRHQPYLRQVPDLKPTAGSSAAASSRETSPQYEDARERPVNSEYPQDLVLPASIPLPPGTDSPLKGRSPSPDPAEKERRRRKERERKDADNEDSADGSTLTNYIRFAIRAEVQHREPFVALFNYVGGKIDLVTKNRSTTTLSIIIGLLSITFLRTLFLPPVPHPVPDLVKLSGFAKTFEPLIHYSENGVQQIGTLQETGVAVWDLGESVRGSNMTSAPIIVRELDELSESLKALSLELTRFFSNVDADIDSILIVMEWAKRELEAISSQPATSLSSTLFDNVHSFLSRLGALETTVENGPSGSNDGGSLPVSTRFGSIVTTIFGTTRSQRTHQTLIRTFTELVSVLEECINGELTHSTALFALFESIDRQFLNLQRTVVRESNAQERAEGEMLSSLWTRVLGPNAAVLRKYEKNRRLLASVRQRTVSNKHLLMDHRGRLLTLKVNLETLRRKLVSPLLRRNDSVSFGLVGAGGTAGENSASPSSSSSPGAGAGAGGKSASAVEIVIDGQIRGLEGAYEYLREVRDRQKAKLMEMVYGAGSRQTGSGIAGVLDEINNDGSGANVEEIDEQ